MESCLNYSCLERQSLSLSIFSFVSIHWTWWSVPGCRIAGYYLHVTTSLLHPDPSQVSAFPLLRLSVFFTYANMSMSFFVGRRESNPCSLRRTDTQHIGSFIRLLYRWATPRLLHHGFPNPNYLTSRVEFSTVTPPVTEFDDSILRVTEQCAPVDAEYLASLVGRVSAGKRYLGFCGRHHNIVLILSFA